MRRIRGKNDWALLSLARLVFHSLGDDLEAWRTVTEHWRALGKDLRHLEVPPELAPQLGVPLELSRRREAPQEDDDMTEAESTAIHEPKWKKRKSFDGSTCGYVACSRKAEGYVSGKRSTKEGQNGALWYGPACTPCVRGWHKTLRPISLAELAQQRNGLSDLAAVLDLEVGEVEQRLEAAGIDAKGRHWELRNPRNGAIMSAPTNGAPQGQAAQETVALAVVIPYDSIEAKTAEAQQTLVALQSFQITCQEQMDYASGYLQRVKGLWSELDEQRKQAGRPLNKKLQEIRNKFSPALDFLSQVEARLKQCIQEGYRLAQQAQAGAFQQAEAALEQGNLPGAALATQAAVASDVNLSPGISMRKLIRFQIMDPSQLPAPFWSPDPSKVQAAIDAGHRQIPGVHIWEEDNVAARRA